MILRDLHVEGFGVHHDLRHSFSPNLNLIVGPNEAGKTTLHAFVRGLLYGFPRSNMDGYYSALRGGRHGGALSLETEDGVYRILRSAEPKRTLKVELPGGGSGGKEVLDRLLRKTDAQLFNNVFAFGLDELMNFGNLMGEEMELRIFDTAIAGAGRSVTQIVKDLGSIKQEELGPKSGRVRKLAKRMAELEKELAAARAQAKGYAIVEEEVRRLEEAVGEAEERAEAARLEDRRWSNLISLWPEERRRQEAVQILAALPEQGADAASISADLLTRFDHHRAQLGGLESAAERRRLETERLRRDQEEAASNEALVRVAERAALLLRDQRLQADRQERIVPLRLSIEQSAEAAAGGLRSLGPGWTEELVRGVDRSLPRREELDAFAARFRESERDREPARLELRAAESRLDQATSQLDETTRLLAEHGEGEAREILERRVGALTELRAARAERTELGRRLDGIRDRRNATGQVPVDASWIRQALWAGTCLFVVAALAGTFLSSLPAALVAGLAAVFFGALALLWPGVRGGGRAPAAGASSATLEAELLEQIRRSEETVRRSAEALGLTGSPSPAEIEAAAEALRRAQGHRDRWEDLQREKQERDARHRQALESVSDAKEELDRLKARERALEGEWAAWLESVFGRAFGSLFRGRDARAASVEAGQAGDTAPRVEEVPGSGADGSAVGSAADRGGSDGSLPLPAAVRDRLVRIEEVVKPLDQGARDQAQLRQLEEDVAAWNRELIVLAADAGIEGSGEEALARLSLALEQEREKEAKRIEVERELGRLADEEELAAASRERLKGEMGEILAAAGASDREGLAARIEEDHERRAARERIAIARRAIDERLGLGDDAEAVRLELERGEIGRWVEAKERSEAEARAMAAELKERISDRTRAEERRNELAASADVPRVAAELAQVRAEFEGSVQRWRAAALLERLLRTSLEDLRRERQPAVLREAGEAFRKITDGRYLAILQSLEGDGVEVLDEHERRIAATALSRGTREQLYICIRLGLAAAFAEKGTRLPLVLDDVLVNFDPERAEHAAQVLAEHAQRQQILLFTCHPQTVERILALAPDAAVLELAA